MEKLHVSAYSGHIQVLTTFLLKEFYILYYIILYKTQVILYNTSGFDNYLAKRVLYNIILYNMIHKTLLARKLSKPEDGRYRPKHVVFPLLINTII